MPFFQLTEHLEINEAVRRREHVPPRDQAAPAVRDELPSLLDVLGLVEHDGNRPGELVWGGVDAAHDAGVLGGLGRGLAAD